MTFHSQKKKFFAHQSPLCDQHVKYYMTVLQSTVYTQFTALANIILSTQNEYILIHTY